MPKLTHLLISLPDPEDYFLKDMNTLFYKFIWKNKPENLKRDLMTQYYKEGGTKMINIHHFKTSLKCTWVRRLFLDPNGSVFSHLSQILQKKHFIRYSDHFIIHKYNRMSNMFWKETLLSWITTEQNHKPQAVDAILSINIRHNRNIV